MLSIFSTDLLYTPLEKTDKESESSSDSSSESDEGRVEPNNKATKVRKYTFTVLLLSIFSTDLLYAPLEKTHKDSESSSESESDEGENPGDEPNNKATKVRNYTFTVLLLSIYFH